MKLEKGIVSFDYDGTRFNVPISEPWDVYTDDDDCVYIDSDNESKVDRTIDPLNFFTIHLTERCNLKCTYCFEGDKGNKDFTLENIDQFIQFVKENKLKDITIRFFGGEPLLNIPIIKNIIKTVEYNLSDVKVNYNIFTNGTILNDDVINLIKEKI
ncbi:4Fe-4S cluster-binding domain-containing protein [Paraclostridium sp. AKS46]|nr:4Fe-4S cluster-binding domain-containing protein [Paraclostridium sp. AKS46]